MSDPPVATGAGTPAGTATGGGRRALPTAVAVGLDAACVLAFVAAGRMSHDGALTGLLPVAAPFLAAGAVAHLAVRRGRDRLWPGGVAVWLGTWAGGMALRAVLHDGVAPAFVGVGLGVLGVTMLGWRAVAAAVAATANRRRRPTQ